MGKTTNDDVGKGSYNEQKDDLVKQKHRMAMGVKLSGQEPKPSGPKTEK